MTDLIRQLTFVDIETFGLDTERHAIFEIAMVDISGKAKAFFMEPGEKELAFATPEALNITRYYERRRELMEDDATPSIQTGEVASDLDVNPEPLLWVPVGARPLVANYIAETLVGHIAGNCISFDAERLSLWLRVHSAAPRWHYHLVDVEAVASGALGLLPPWKSDELSSALGVDVPKDQHTALADAQWSREMFLAAIHLSDQNRPIEERQLPTAGFVS